ncbi:MAG TPA: hypothetical protein VF841_08600 [Anaeromyxobacter sp.]
MRSVPVLACAALCLAAAGVRADDDPAATAATRARDAGRREAPPRWGLLAGAGFPEGIAADAVFRPVSDVRLFAGPMWNWVGWGVQGGVTLVPWHLGVSPVLSLEGGRYFKADARFLAGNAGGIPAEVKPLLGSVSYDYGSLRVGVEIGSRDAFAISVLAGLSYVSLTASGTSTTTVTTSGGQTATVTFTDPRLRGTMPSVKAGVQLWF